jgi:DNA adenine methylase
MKAPFPWFGGKSRVAHLVWDRFGDAPIYVEPFFGSGAVLLNRPHPPGIETVNDKDAYLTNFWRAIQSAPDETAAWADWPVSEVDLNARHRWLMETGAERLQSLNTDPMFYDAMVAGWWVWGLCCWIGSGWCVRGSNQLPHLSNAGQGINRELPHLADVGRAGHIAAYFAELSARLRNVRICQGGWDRVLSPVGTTLRGLTAVFLDPPYTEGDVQYSAGGCGGHVERAVTDWAIANGDNPQFRIALCGYEDGRGMPASWECIEWKARNGSNRHRERVWFSPHCLHPQGNLFYREIDAEMAEPDAVDVTFPPPFPPGISADELDRFIEGWNSSRGGITDG